MKREILKKIILSGTSDKDIEGTDGGFAGLEYIIYEPIPDEHEVFNVGIPYDDQIWVRPEFPDFSKLTKKECQDLYIREIRRIKNGIYIWIGGELEYITGKHYFGLVHWKLRESNANYLIYTQTQRNIFYLFDLCEHDTKCAGAIVFSLKRLGKSELVQVEMFADAILSETGRYIVQALNDDEAIDIFNKTHYANENLNLSLPIWGHKYLKSDPPPSNLVALKRESTKDSIVWKSADGIEGSNEINFSVKPTKLTGIQGKKIKRAFLDEFASLEPIKDMTLQNYHSKAIAQVTEDFGAVVTGKVWLIATAENITSKALRDAEKIWDDSDETRKDANGFTPSRMKRMLIPYYLGGRSNEFMDKFGRPNIDKSKTFYENSLGGLSDSKKILYRRQNPENIGDVFNTIMSGFWEADVKLVLDEVKKKLNNAPSLPIKKVNLVTFGDSLKFVAAKNNDETSVSIFEDPKQHVKYYAGFDGVGSDKETGNEKGSCVSVTILKGADSGANFEYLPVAYFKFRPDNMPDGYRATLNICKHYGQFGNLKLGIERNAGQGSPLIAYFINRGYRKMLMKKQKVVGIDGDSNSELYGWYRNDEVIDVQKSYANEYLRNFAHNIPFIELVESLIDYGKSNQDFADSFISAVYTMGDFNRVTKKKAIRQVSQWVLDGITRGSDGLTKENWREVKAMI